MAETALKFGPEWLRALSHGKSAALPPPAPGLTKYKLAQFRYGREEMLALFNKDTKPPNDLTEFTYLCIEKSQLPLALLQTTEEEQRLWSRSVNSDVVLKLMAKGNSGQSVARNSRGGSTERGRGRGRGSFYRDRGFDDAGEGPPGGFSRTRQFERSSSLNEREHWDERERRLERSFSGRGNSLEENGVTSRKEPHRAPLDNWRSTREPPGDEDSGWRGAGFRDPDKWRDHLPEWSTEDNVNAEQVGTFDSTGAFMESHNELPSSDDYGALHSERGKHKGKTKELSDDSSDPTEPSSKSPSHKTLVKFPEKGHSEVQNSVPSKDKPESSGSNSEKPISRRKSPVQTAKQEVAKEETQKSSSDMSSASKPPLSQPPCSVLPSGLSNSKVQSNEVNNRPTQNTNGSQKLAEEDGFAHIQKAAENMVAQWTADEEEQRVIPQTEDTSNHEDTYKWYYRDPQNEIQGPFSSQEMLDWFSAGYFTMGLMVRRGCDERFAQLGELIKSWGRVPFTPGPNLPPIKLAPQPPPSSLPATNPPQLMPAMSHLRATQPQDPQQQQLHILQQQLMQQQQMLQQQLLLRQQTQIQQLFGQLKQHENFASLPPQQQHQVLLQHMLTQQQQLPRHPGPSMQPTLLDPLLSLQLPLLGLPVPSLLKSNSSQWSSLPANPGSWPTAVNGVQEGSSIWDIETTTDASSKSLQSQDRERKEKEEEERRELEEKERREEERRRLAEEEKQRKEEELRRQKEEEEAEARRKEELRKQEEERKQQEELRLLEERRRQKKEEEERLRLEEEERQRIEELKRQEERRRVEELRRQEERRRAEELRQQEEKRRLEALRLQEERRKEEEQRRHEEELRLEEEIRKEEEERRQEEKRKQQRELEMQRQLEHQKELEMEHEMEQMMERERQKEQLKQQELMQKLQEQRRAKTQVPAWGGQRTASQNSTLSLAEIQKLQEEKEKEDREEIQRHQQVQQQQHQLQILQQLQQQQKASLGWAQRPGSRPNAPVQSLLEIQQEEAEKLARQQKAQQEQKQQNMVPLETAGIWSNASSHLTWGVPSIPGNPWGVGDNNNDGSTNSVGFWDDVISVSSSHNKTMNAIKTNESAFPTSNMVPSSADANRSKTLRARKDEETVKKLFEMRTKQSSDEFTQWCIESLDSLASSVDVPTFVAFLKDVESPYEVHDYVRSYLGESKGSREFAKQFLEKRSQFRNQAKQNPAEENMWGPAPAITPSVNKILHPHLESDSGNGGGKGKKKKKNRMQKLDISMLGFTVQPDPDRINVGEIDHVEGM